MGRRYDVIPSPCREKEQVDGKRFSGEEFS